MSLFVFDYFSWTCSRQSHGVKVCGWCLRWKHKANSFPLFNLEDASDSAWERHHCWVHKKWRFQVSTMWAITKFSVVQSWALLAAWVLCLSLQAFALDLVFWLLWFPTHSTFTFYFHQSRELPLPPKAFHKWNKYPQIYVHVYTHTHTISKKILVDNRWGGSYNRGF